MLSDFQRYADRIIEEQGIPAVSLAVWKDGELYQAASGILNVETQVAATPDSVFQVGSITKIVTASLIMQLVDDGRIELDAPVKAYLKDFRAANPYITDHVTVRQLLNHTSGMAGDFFPTDDRTGGDAIARYVDRCYFLPQVHPLGEKHSYSNSAYVIAGRLIEVLNGTSWSDAVQEHFIKPLELTHTFVDPLNAPRFRTAIGHEANPNIPEGWMLPPNAYLPQCLAPAGALLSMSAGDLITFARAHLNHGLINGSRWLSAEAVEQMQTSNMALPRFSSLFATDRGLGWQIADGVIGHNGSSCGQNAMLRLLPEHNIAFAVLINGRKPEVLATIYTELMLELAGISIERPQPKDSSVSLAPLTGVYDCLDSTVTAMLDDGELIVERIDNIHPLSPPARFSLKPIDALSFAVYTDNGKRLGTMVFLDPNENGEPAYLYSGSRLHNRIKHADNWRGI